MGYLYLLFNFTLFDFTTSRAFQIADNEHWYDAKTDLVIVKPAPWGRELHTTEDILKITQLLPIENGRKLVNYYYDL